MKIILNVGALLNFVWTFLLLVYSTDFYNGISLVRCKYYPRIFYYYLQETEDDDVKEASDSVNIVSFGKKRVAHSQSSVSTCLIFFYNHKSFSVHIFCTNCHLLR